MVSNKHADATGSAVRQAAGGGRRTLTAGPGPFGGLGRAVVRHPWLTILAWVVAAVAVIATSPGLPTTTNESSFLPKPRCVGRQGRLARACGSRDRC